MVGRKGRGRERERSNIQIQRLFQVIIVLAMDFSQFTKKMGAFDSCALRPLRKKRIQKSA